MVGKVSKNLIDNKPADKDLGTFKIDGKGRLIFHQYCYKDKIKAVLGYSVGIGIGLVAMVFCPIVGVFAAVYLISMWSSKQSKKQ